MMFLFNKRHNLSKMFDKWAKENNAVNCSLNVITWLDLNDLIDVEKALKFLEENKDAR